MKDKNYTSITLSEKLYKRGFVFDYDFVWRRGKPVPTENQHPPFTEYEWNLVEDDGVVGFNGKSFPAYDILNDLCVKYPKELFGETFFHRPEMVLSYLQQNQKEKAEKYIIENLVTRR